MGPGKNGPLSAGLSAGHDADGSWFFFPSLLGWFVWLLNGFS